MAIVDGVIPGILKIKPSLQFAPDDHKESSKFQIPKSASISNWNSRCDFCKLRCSSSPSSSSSSSSSYPPELKFMRHFSPNLVDDFNSLYPDGDVLEKFTPNRQTLLITVVLDDENGQLRRKIDDLVAKKDYLCDVRKRVDIVLDEVVPLLLENANRWISSRLVVSPSQTEAADAILSEDVQDASLIRYSPKRNRCSKVLLEVAIVDTIDDKFTDIHTRDDLVAFFQHLMCREGISGAFAVCLISLIFKEKTQAFEHYTHAPRRNKVEANSGGQSPLTIKILKYLVESISFISNLL